MIDSNWVFYLNIYTNSNIQPDRISCAISYFDSAEYVLFNGIDATTTRGYYINSSNESNTYTFVDKTTYNAGATTVQVGKYYVILLCGGNRGAAPVDFLYTLYMYRASSNYVR